MLEVGHGPGTGSHQLPFSPCLFQGIFPAPLPPHHPPLLWHGPRATEVSSRLGRTQESHPGPRCPLRFLADSGTGITDRACEPRGARSNRMRAGWDPVGCGRSWLCSPRCSARVLRNAQKPQYSLPSIFLSHRWQKYCKPSW